MAVSCGQGTACAKLKAAGAERQRSPAPA